MSERFDYKSPLAPYMNDFMTLKEASGIVGLRQKWILLEIDKFYISQGIDGPVVTSEIVSMWRKTRANDSDRTLYAKYSVWSQLTRFMCRQGLECYIPPLPDTRSVEKGFAPYIFTHGQVRDIMDKSSALRLYDRHMSCTMIIIPAVIRLLYSTGLRISETLSIKNGDVHMDENYIHIKKTKNGHERLVPICDSMKDVLVQYIRYRDMMPLKNTSNQESFLFVKMDGTPCSPGNVYTWFKRVLRECGIPHIGNHHGPRVHDVRHTFAVHAFEKMAKEGIDLYTSMPVISACLGHRSLSATEQYVRLTGEMYPELVEMSSPINAFVYPKVRKGVPYED